MKKRALIMLALAACIFTAGCSQKKETEKATEKTQASVETEASTDHTKSEDAAAEDMDQEAGEAAEEAIAQEIRQRPTYRALDYVTVGEYKNLPVTPITMDEMVDQRITQALSAASKYEKLEEGIVQSGDIANIDYEGKQDGVPFPGGTAAGYDLTIGSGSFIDGFEDGLIGVAIGDTVDLNLTFPEQYHSEKLAGAAVVFTVKVNYVQRAPETITDDLVKELTDSEYTNVADYRASLEEEITPDFENYKESGIYTELMTQVYNNCTINDYPPELIEYGVASMTDYYKQYAQSNNMEWEDFLSQALGMDEASFKEAAESSTRNGLQQELILMAIAETEGLDQVSDGEYQQKCEEYTQSLGYESVDEFKAEYDPEMIRVSIVIEKAQKFVRDNALLVTAEELEALSEAEETEA